MAFLSKIRSMDLFNVVTVGFPFCAFKILTGLTLQTMDVPTTVKRIGVLLVCLGVIDLVINGVNFVSLAIRGRRWLDACLFALLMRSIKSPAEHTDWSWQDLGNSLDVLLSFTLVACAIGFGMLKLMNSPAVTIWNVSVVFNVLGAGLGRLGGSIQNLGTPKI
ncbi:MAG: hypothetical protein V1495_00110 [Pseudomonadota bacterium]